MNFKRIGRILVCLVLVCALVINISPIRAEAVLIELTTAQLINLGVAALASLMVCGIYYNIQHDNQLEALGRDFYSTLSYAIETEEETEILDIWLGSIWVDDIVVNWKATRDAGNGFLLAAFCGLLTKRFDIASEAIVYPDPQYTVCNVGDTFEHYSYDLNGPSGLPVKFEILSCSAPVIRFTVCNSGHHYTINTSTASFTVKIDSNTYRANAITIDGNSFYFSLSDYSGYFSYWGPECNYTNQSYTYDDLQKIAAYIVGNGIPEKELYPSGYEGDLQEEFNSGNVETLEIPDIDLSNTSKEELLEMANKVISGEMTHQEVLDRLTGGQTVIVNPVTEPEIGTDPDPDPDPSESTETTNPVDPGGGSESGDGEETDYTSWFERLITRIEEIPSKIGAWFADLINFAKEFPDLFWAWTDTIPTLFETWIGDIRSFAQEFPSLFEEWVNNIIGAIQNAPAEIEQWINGLPDRFAGYFQSIQQGISSTTEAISNVVNPILSGMYDVIVNALSFVFAPSEGFLEGKVTALKEKYPFVQTFSDLGLSFKSFFNNIGSTPPVIWIDLGAGSGFYPMGGKVKFLDLAWYAQYKPMMDNITGGFLWLWTGWRLFQSAPGIISGASGLFGTPQMRREVSNIRRKETDGE